MKDKHARHGIEWRLMDVRDMKDLEEGSVDVAFDKATLDSMIYGSPWTPPQDVKDNTAAYLREVSAQFSYSSPCSAESRILTVLSYVLMAKGLSGSEK